MNKLLAHIAVLKQKAYALHWGVKGDDFISMHKLSEALYEELVGMFDKVAEKVVMRGEIPLSRLEDYVKHSSIKEINIPKDGFSKKDLSEILVADLDILEKVALEVKSDHMIQPLLDEIFMAIDKHRWFFRASK